MTTDQIISIIISVFPSALAILTMVGVVLRVVKDFNALKAQVTDMKDIRDLNDKLGDLIRENYELKKKLNETLTKIDHIERK